MALYSAFFAVIGAAIISPPVRREITAKRGERRLVCWLRVILAETLFGLFVLSGTRLALLLPEPLMSAVFAAGVVLLGFVLTVRPVAATLRLMTVVLLVVGLIAAGNRVTNGYNAMGWYDAVVAVYCTLYYGIARFLHRRAHRVRRGSLDSWAPARPMRWAGPAPVLS